MGDTDLGEGERKNGLYDEGNRNQATSDGGGDKKNTKTHYITINDIIL